jgi:hypothetical protein
LEGGVDLVTIKTLLGHGGTGVMTKGTPADMMSL